MINLKKIQNTTSVEVLSITEITAFQREIYSYYHNNGRKFPWRDTDNPYHILISEVMLQQTQVNRVLEKYEQFLTVFPSVAALGAAPISAIYTIWQGLGYNRRVLFLKETARLIQQHYNGKVPSDTALLSKLPGIGKNTASAIVVFAYNKPEVFIETNIRAVYIHFFSHNSGRVADKHLIPFISKTLVHNNPRLWYYALMDYGVMLKKEYSNPGRKSAHYIKQTAFEGSDRQIRGNILKQLSKQHKMTGMRLKALLSAESDRVDILLKQLQKEGIIQRVGKFYCLQ